MLEVQDYHLQYNFHCFVAYKVVTHKICKGKKQIFDSMAPLVALREKALTV